MVRLLAEITVYPADIPVPKDDILNKMIFLSLNLSLG
jgi:hypothetical protein